MKLSRIALLLCLAASPACAGGSTAPGIVQSGAVTAGHCAQFSASGVAIDSGNPCGTGSSGVSQFSGGTTGLTPSSGTTGAITLGGTLGVANGGTGATGAQGNGAKVQLSTGTTTTNDCVKFDANGNTIDAGAACGSGSGGVTTTGSPVSGNLSKFSGSSSITNADLTGDVTTSGGVTTTLSTVNSNSGTFGDSSHCANFTVNAKGLITAAAQSTSCPGAGGGSVSVTAATPGIVITPSPGTGTFTIGATYPGRTVTGTTDTILSTDIGGSLITYNSAAAVAVTLPAATTTGFGSGGSFDVQNMNLGTVTITPTTSTINGVASLTVPYNTGCTIRSDGTNYQVSACNAKGRNDLAADFSGKPSAGMTYTYVTGRTFMLPVGLTGTQAHIGINPTASFTVTLYKNGTSIGTIVFSTGGTPAITFSSSVSFAAGDVLTATCPNTQDATASDVAFTLLGTLT